MAEIAFGIFILLHGLVHLFYFGHSLRLFELTPNFVWPDGSWAFSTWLGVENSRKLAGILLVGVTITFLLGAIGFFVSQDWWRPLVTGAAVFSTLVYIFFWDGSTKMLSEKGGIGILINLALLAALWILQWPDAGG